MARNVVAGDPSLRLNNGYAWLGLNMHLTGRHPEGPRFYQRAEGSHVARNVVAGDPSLRLKNGYAQDDAIDERATTSSFCYQIVVRGARKST